MLKFEILSPGDGVSRVVEIGKSPIKVGKLSTSDLSMDDASVSRMHARIEASGGVFRVVDLGSAGGTYVNDQKVMAQQFYSGDVLRFGNVRVRCTQAGVSVPLPVPPIPKPVFSANRVEASGVGFSAPPATPPRLIRRKKKGVSFERRFLSERCPKGEGSLEIAHMWRDEVVKIRQFASKNDAFVTIGAETGKGVDFIVEDPRLGGRTPVLQRRGDAWQLLFTNEFEGFLLVDPSKYNGVERIAFKDCTPGQFPPASVDGIVKSGWMSADIDGETRAKLIFGEVAILVHCAKTFVVPVGAKMKAGVGLGLGLGVAMVASLLLHLSLFSVVLFTTNRVDGFMVDRVMTTARFADALILQEKIEVAEKPDKPDEIEEMPEEKPDNHVTDGKAVATPFSGSKSGPGNGSNSGPGNGTGTSTSRSDAAGLAQSQGLLAQANVMSSMMASGMATNNLDVLDWSNFNPSAAANSPGFLPMTSGTHGGGSDMGGFRGPSAFGPPGGPGDPGSGIATKARGRCEGDCLGPKLPPRDPVRPGTPKITGSLTRPQILKVVNQHRAELRACYEREANRIKGLNGKLDVNWIIAVNGSVVHVGINESTINNKSVEDCVLNSIKHWRFPSPAGGGMVQITSYPFIFDIGGGN